MDNSQHTPRIEPRWEKVAGTDEIVAWQVWVGVRWFDSFDNETDAIDYRDALSKVIGSTHE